MTRKPEYRWREIIGQPDPEDGYLILSEIDVPALATVRSLKGYTDKEREHESRNQPDLIRELLTMYLPADKSARVWDPFCGSGTVIKEAQKLGYQNAFGWDIIPSYRTLWPEGSALRDPEPDSLDLIILSPEYWDTAHDSGDTEAQRRYQEQRGSRAGKSKPKAPGHFAHVRELSAFLFRLLLVYEKCFKSLKPGGSILVIVRDKQLNGELFRFHTYNAEILEHAGFQIPGKHPRKHRPTSWWHQREKIQPGQIIIDVEWTIRGLKP